MGYHQLLRSMCNRVAAFNRRMRENRTYGGVGGCRGAIPGTRPDPVQGGNPAKAGQATGAVGVLRSSDEPAYSKGAGERREGTWVNVNANSAGSGDGRSAEETLSHEATAMNDLQIGGCGQTACPVLVRGEPGIGN